MFSDPWPAAAFRDLLGELALVVAAAPDQVAGYLFARRAADEGEILNLAVHPAHVRRGLGTKLVQAVLADFQASGVMQVFLEVRESNQAAQAFYQEIGFRAVSRRAGYYSHPREDALIFIHEISGVRRPA